MKFIKEDRVYVDYYLIRTTQCKLSTYLNLENLLKECIFWKLIQRKEKKLDIECLGLLFNFKNIKASDFKKFDKVELMNYIKNFILNGVDLDVSIFNFKNEKVNFDSVDNLIEFCKNNTEQEKQKIQKLKEWFLNFKNNLKDADEYFVLNKDWFSLDDYRIFEIEYLAYPVYIFIIFFIENNVFTCELSWD